MSDSAGLLLTTEISDRDLNLEKLEIRQNDGHTEKSGLSCAKFAQCVKLEDITERLTDRHDPVTAMTRASRGDAWLARFIWCMWGLS